MATLPIAIRTNESKYSYSGEARLINAYAEAQGADAKAPYAVLPCYGLTEFATVTDTQGRGLIALEDQNCLYSVHPTSVYKVPQSGPATRIGTIPGSDIVQISRNQAVSPQVSIHCAAGEFFIQNDVVTRVTDTDLPSGVNTQDQIGGFTAYALPDRRVFLSAINACDKIDGLDFATAEQSADPLVRVKADGGDLHVMKRRSIEPWRLVGGADFPLQLVGGATIRKGLLAPNAVTVMDNSLHFVGDDCVAYRLQGYQPQRISNHGVERKIETDSGQDSLAVFSYNIEGHSFFSVSGSEFTRTYDAATTLWHSRQSYGLPNWRARNPVRIWGKTIVQDALSGKLFYLDRDNFTEDGAPLIWGMDTPTYHLFPFGGTMDALHIDCATGYATTSGQGSNPKMMVSWSVDGGATWKGHRELSLGGYGNRVRVTTRRLGRFGPKGVTFRIRVSDPVVRSIIALDLQSRPLKR